MTKAGGPAALKGFRLQTTYLLKRLLTSDEHVVFRPEGDEDIDVLDLQGNPVEHVQVKAYGKPFSLTHLITQDSDPGEQQSQPPYLERALHRIQTRGTRETVVIIGKLGPEIAGAFQGDPKHRASVEGKLRKKGYSDWDLELIFTHVTVEAIGEEEAQQHNLRLLGEGITAGDVRFSHNAISYWLYELSESHQTLTPSRFWEEVHQVGRSATEQGAHQQEWGKGLKSILPDDLTVEDPETLRRQLYEGMGARPEHIQAGVDVRRETLLETLHAAVEEHAVVVIRGASGQGKSALAYRHLHEKAIPAFSFKVDRLKDQAQAERVALAIKSRLRATRVPMWVLLDAQPGGTAWLDLLQNLLNVERLKVLVTVREDDWTRAQAELGSLPHHLIPLQFTATEGEQMFTALTQVQPSEAFLTFDEAWRRFEERGPLLEFVFMVTHKGVYLENRLRGQLEDLQDEWDRHPERLDFLHAAAIAAAFHARVSTRALAGACDLHARHTAETIKTLEREHLLRVSEGSTFIEGLHAIRSQKLLELLNSPETPATQAFQRVAQAVQEEDLEIFLLHALLNLPPEAVLEVAQGIQVETWRGRLGVLRVLMWWDVRLHLDTIRPAIDRAFETFEYAWWLFMPMDILGLRQHHLVPEEVDWAGMDFVQEPMRIKVREIQGMVTQEQADFHHSKTWLKQPWLPKHAPEHMQDWAALSELAFFTGLWGLPEDAFFNLPLRDVEGLSLEEAADVHYALTFLKSEALSLPRDHLRDVLLDRLKTEGNVTLIEDNGTVIKVHFVVPTGPDPVATVEGSEHHKPDLDATLRRLGVLQHLVPDRETYASQGYGHMHGLIKHRLLFDDTQKNINRTHFPPIWGVRWHGVLHHLANLKYVLDDWKEHATYQMERRKEVVEVLESITEGVLSSARKDQEFWKVKLFFEVVWATRNKLQGHHTLPRKALDPWGLTSNSNYQLRRLHLQSLLGSLNRQFDGSRHEPYLKAMRDYFGSLMQFFMTATRGMHALAQLRIPRDMDRAKRVFRKLEKELQGLHHSLPTLQEALQKLPAFQKEFRERFTEHLGEEELSTLEEKEKRVLEDIWKNWMDVARPPGPSGRVYGPAGEKILAMYQRRLKEALEELAWTGLEARVVKTPELYKGRPTLWIQVDMPVVQQRDLAHLRVLHAIHRAIAPAGQHQWWQDVLLHMWDTVVVIPTCQGRPWRPEGWVHSLWNMVTPPDSKDPVLNQRIFLPESLLTRLGFNMWDMNMAEEVNLLRAQLLEHHQQANRIREIERMLELSCVNKIMVQQLLDAEEETLQQRVQEAFQLMTAHLGSMPGNAALVASPQALLQRDHLFTQRNFNETWPLAVPQVADFRTLNAIEVLTTLELRQLNWENRRINTLTQNTFQKDLWPTDFDPLEP